MVLTRLAESAHLHTRTCEEIFEKLLVAVKIFRKLLAVGKFLRKMREIFFCTNHGMILKQILQFFFLVDNN